MSKRKYSSEMLYHYTYRITNTVEKKYYYGMHSCDCLPKEDIGVKYWSSSKKPSFINDQKVNPQNYKYKIIKIFNTRTEALEHEIFLHKKFEVGVNLSFYNGAKQTSTKFDTSGIPYNKGVPKTESCKKKLSALYKGKTFEEIHGFEKAQEIKQRISDTQKGVSRITPEGRIQLSLKKKGVPCFTNEDKERMSAERKNKIHVKNLITNIRYRLDDINEFNSNPFIVGSMLKYGYEIILHNKKIIIFKHEYLKLFCSNLSITGEIVKNAKPDIPYKCNFSGISLDRQHIYKNIEGMLVKILKINDINLEYINSNIDNIYNPTNYDINGYINEIGLI